MRTKPLLNTANLIGAATSAAVIGGLALSPAAAEAASRHFFYCNGNYAENRGCSGVSTSDRFGNSSVYNEGRNAGGHGVAIVAIYNNSRAGHSHRVYSGASVISYFSHVAGEIVRGECKNITAGTYKLSCNETGWDVIV